MSSDSIDLGKEARRLKVEEIKRKMEGKSGQGSSRDPIAAASPPSATAVAADGPNELGDLDVDDVERILEKAARLLREEEKRKQGTTIATATTTTTAATAGAPATPSSASSAANVASPGRGRLKTEGGDGKKKKKSKDRSVSPRKEENGSEDSGGDKKKKNGRKSEKKKKKQQQQQQKEQQKEQETRAGAGEPEMEAGPSNAESGSLSIDGEESGGEEKAAASADGDEEQATEEEEKARPSSSSSSSSSGASASTQPPAQPGVSGTLSSSLSSSPASLSSSSPSSSSSSGWGWQKGSFASPTQPRARPTSTSDRERRMSPLLGLRIQSNNDLRSMSGPQLRKLHHSSEHERNEEIMQRLKTRQSVCFSMQLPTTSPSSSPSLLSGSSGEMDASLARKWGAARRSGPVHTSFQDIMSARSSFSDLSPIHSNTHTMTSKNDEYMVKFVYENELYRILCSCEMNASQIKATMIQHVKSQTELNELKEEIAKEEARVAFQGTEQAKEAASTVEKNKQSLDEKDYLLKIPGVNYYLVKEEQSLHLVGVLQVCRKSFVSFPLEMVPRPPTDVLHENDKLNMKEKIMSELNANTEMFELLANPISGDNPLQDILKSDNDEVISFRKRITKVRRAVLKEREEVIRKAAQAQGESKYDTSFLPQYRESEPLPLNVPDSFNILAYQPADEKDEVLASTQTFNVTRNQTVAELKSKMFRKYKGTHPLATGTEDDYILKVTGYKEYLIGSHKILSYDYIRKCLGKKVTPVLSLVPLKEVDLMIPEPVEDSVADMILSRERNKEMSFSKERFKDIEVRKSISDMMQQLRVKIIGVDNVDTFNHIIKNWMREQRGKKEQKAHDEKAEKENSKNKTYCLYVCAQVYHGDELIADDMYTNAILYSNGPLWKEWLVSSLKLMDIPRGARMCFTLYRRQLENVTSAEAFFSEKGKFNEKTDVPLGWVNCQFIDHKDQLRQGPCSFKLWLGKPNPIGTCVDNVAVKDKERATTLHVEFQIHRTPVIFPPTVDLAALRAANKKTAHEESQDSAKMRIIKLQIEEIMKKDPLTPLQEDERRLLWEHREYCSQFPSLLPRFLQYVKWNDRDSVSEAYRMLPLWAEPSPFEALSLLDAKYASPVVRAYAVKRLHELDDRALSDFLLQLTQVLKYEAYHYSPLAEFLLSRALLNVNQIGHAFFWLLKSELHNPTIASRYSLLAEAYLRGCGAHRQELVKQTKVLNQLAKVAMRVKEAPSADKKKVLEEELRKVEFPAKFQLPLDPRQEVKGLIIEKCKYMDSKKLPLWLVFENAEKRGAPVRVIFKAGDDLRQDVLTLQMLRIMDKLWKEEGLDLRLNAYGCVATGDELGMIEVVLNASTTASVNKERGGSKAVLYKDTLTSWLKEKNPSPDKFETAQQNFLLSCAGYCVATYVLGIGDRHNDNIMITEFGHLFHIDFGHFLGNVKSKLGIKRERAPFIFNPQFAHVLGGAKGELYAQFVETCQRAYNIVRKHAHMFINLFMMMLSTGIPELQNEEDIAYMCNSLLTGADEKAAAENFAKLIEEARKTKSVLINDIVHIWAHSKK